MKFIVGSGEQLRDRLETFPEKYRNAFSLSKILVVGVMSNNDVVGACGISKVSNYVLIYVQEKYRGKGLGTKLEAKACEEAHKHSLDFVARAVHLWNLPSLRVASKVGYREVAQFRDFGYVLMIIPLNIKGKLVYTFLHGVCSKLPGSLLHRIVLLLMSVVGLIRQRTSAVEVKF